MGPPVEVDPFCLSPSCALEEYLQRELEFATGSRVCRAGNHAGRRRENPSARKEHGAGWVSKLGVVCYVERLHLKLCADPFRNGLVLHQSRGDDEKTRAVQRISTTGAQ